MSIDTIRNKAGRAVRYRVRYRTPEGASRSRTFDELKKARSFEATVTTSKDTGEFVDPKDSKISFGAYAEQWAAAQPHRVTTAESVDTTLRVHLLPLWKDRKIGTIKTSEVQAWVTGLDLAPSTVKVAYGKLAAIFGAAVEDRVIARTPCTRSVKLPRAVGAEVVPMTPVEVAGMAEAIERRYRALVVLLAGSALRPGEGLGLTKDRVNFLRRTIRVDRQLVATKGSIGLAPTKTASSVRTIPVPKAVTDELARHIELYGCGEDGLIFTDDQGRPVHRRRLSRVWSTAAVTAKVVDRTPHDLRHYAASVLIDQGASVKAVQKHLGHASATTTLDVYAHLWPDSEDVTRRALEAGLSQLVSKMCHDAEPVGAVAT